MIIGAAGAYSASTAEQRKASLDALNIAAAGILERGQIPLIGVKAALPVIEQASVANPYEAIMDISMAVIDRCEALLLISESPVARRERDLAAAKGIPRLLQPE